MNAATADQGGAAGVAPEAAVNETGQSEFDGTQVRGLRKVRRLSLTMLAEKTGLSIGYLSQIERNLSTPSVKALTTIAQALGVTVGWFFHGGEAGPKEEKETIVRRGNRRQIMFRDGFVDFLLSPTLEGRLELILTHFRPGASTGEPYTHRGEEGGMVLKGRLEITVGDQNFVLEEGDSFSFQSTRPHSYRNVFDGETVVMYAVTPPSY